MENTGNNLPQENRQIAKTPTTSHRVLFGGACAVIVLAAAGAVYFWQQQKIDRLQTQISQLTSKANQLEQEKTEIDEQKQELGTTSAAAAEVVETPSATEPEPE